MWPTPRQWLQLAAAPRNDVGLSSEGYDPTATRLLGNIPQAFSRTVLVNTALQLRCREYAFA